MQIKDLPNHARLIGLIVLRSTSNGNYVRAGIIQNTNSLLHKKLLEDVVMFLDANIETIATVLDMIVAYNPIYTRFEFRVYYSKVNDCTYVSYARPYDDKSAESILETGIDLFSIQSVSRN